jgi:acyl-CoA oxidase
MPATSPCGYKKVGIVAAKLVIDGNSKGTRHFIVPICDEKEMYRGVTCYPLPPRPGTSPLDFSVTQFDHVLLPHSALLGDELYSVDTRKAWWDEMSRIPVGTFAIGLSAVQGLKQVAFIAGKYSLSRHVAGKESVPVPIISFGTQQILILEAVATAHVMDAWWPSQTKILQIQSIPFATRHAVAVFFKTTVLRHTLLYAPILAERCGAQGTLEPNFMQRCGVGDPFSIHAYTLRLK